MPTRVPVPIKTRIAVLGQIVQSKLAKVLLWPLAGIGAYDTLLSQVLPEDLAKTLPRLRDWFPVTAGWLDGQLWLLILAATFIVVVFEYAHRLYCKTLPKLVLGRVVHEPELGSTLLAMKHIKIKVRNTGAEILQHCSVTFEKLPSDKESTLPDKAYLSMDMTFCAGEQKDIEVAWLDEGQAASEIEFQYAREFQRKVSRNNTYYFHLVAYSVGSPDRKGFRLYVDDGGRLKMEDKCD